MEDSSDFSRAQISQEILSILKLAREQSRSSKGTRVTFNVPKIESVNKNPESSSKPQKTSSLSSKSEFNLIKQFRSSQEELKQKKSKVKLRQDKSKKKPIRKLRKVTYRLKKPKPRYNRPPIEIPELEPTDRPILIKYFKEIVKNFLKQKRRNRLLRRRVRRYLIRRKIKKAFRKRSARKDNAYRETYYKNLEKIHVLRKEMKLMKEAFDIENIVNLKKKDELIEMKNFCLQDFHASVYAKAQEVETARPITERSIKRHLNKFHKLYKEISKIRITNFKSQQLITKYVDKEKKIEEIGDGLTLFDYENMKTRLQIITSNIDAKNKILEKISMRVKKDIKKDPKYMEDLKELDIDLSEVEGNLQELKNEYAKLFNESKRLKNLEKQLESKLDDIYVKGQLLSEQSLMVEYDKMDEKLIEKKDEVARLKDENQKLDQKFRKYEEELKTLGKEKEKAEKNVEPLSLYEERVTLFRKTRTSENLKNIQKSQKMKVPNSGMRK